MIYHGEELVNVTKWGDKECMYLLPSTGEVRPRSEWLQDLGSWKLSIGSSGQHLVSDNSAEVKWGAPESTTVKYTCSHCGATYVMPEEVKEIQLLACPRCTQCMLKLTAIYIWEPGDDDDNDGS